MVSKENKEQVIAQTIKALANLKTEWVNSTCADERERLIEVISIAESQVWHIEQDEVG